MESASKQKDPAEEEPSGESCKSGKFFPLVAPSRRGRHSSKVEEEEEEEEKEEEEREGKESSPSSQGGCWSPRLPLQRRIFQTPSKNVRSKAVINFHQF
ncbi:hypothetical protein E2C01_035010 [Portunus trituberculatus]|uniref:Uncharacterized protein n=1 Tax=Portunus trituberculatus TaxID=210409 RepID=A0A5B7F219_PORTR|nr:hypothetical protein [Portunus trituberculatus]